MTGEQADIFGGFTPLDDLPDPGARAASPYRPCPRCQGRGSTGPSYDERRCFRCGGTGLDRDRIDPAATEIPF